MATYATAAQMPVPQHDQGGKQLRDVLRVLITATERLTLQRHATLSRNDRNKETQETITTAAYDEYEVVKVIRAALGSLESLILDPHDLLLGLSSSYILSRALHIVAEQNIAEHLAQAEQDGLHISQLATLSGIDEGKLCKTSPEAQSKVSLLRWWQR